VLAELMKIDRGFKSDPFRHSRIFMRESALKANSHNKSKNRAEDNVDVLTSVFL